MHSKLTKKDFPQRGRVLVHESSHPHIAAQVPQHMRGSHSNGLGSRWSLPGTCVCLCVFKCVCTQMCVCVCEREREREREREGE